MYGGLSSTAGSWEETGMAMQDGLYYLSFTGVWIGFCCLSIIGLAALNKWEEKNLEHGVSQVTSSACLNLLLIQRAPHKQQNPHPADPALSLFHCEGSIFRGERVSLLLWFPSAHAEAELVGKQ